MFLLRSPCSSDAPAAATASFNTAASSSDAGPEAASDSANPQDAATATLGQITVDELVAALSSKDFLLINVHIPYAGEIPGTDADLPYTDVAAIEAFVGSNLDQKVVVYCLGESMSVPVGNSMVADGYRSVRYLVGGLSAWQSAVTPSTTRIRRAARWRSHQRKPQENS